MSNISLCYLARAGGNYGVKAFKKFLESYNIYHAGIEHDLVILIKGLKKRDEYYEIVKIAQCSFYKIIELPDDGFDIGAYFRAVDILDSEYVCFLNSSSRILSENYLLKLYNQVSKNDVGIVGATGSYECPIITPKYKLLGSKKETVFNKIKEFIYFIKYSKSDDVIWYKCTKNLEFPNYHIRTTGFIIKRELFLKYKKQIKFPKVKSDCFNVEHGEKSLTRYILQNGLKAIVTGKDGIPYFPEEWHVSKTFRHGNCENLLIADNHYDIFINADNNTSNELTYKAYGKWE